MGASTPAARAAAPDRARHDARISRAQSSAGYCGAGAARVRRVRRSVVHRRAVLPDGVYARRRRACRQQALRTDARAAPTGQRADGRCARRAAGSRLARGRSRGFRAARRLSRTPTQAMDRSARAHDSAHAPAARDGERQGVAARANPRVAGADDRPRRLQARQRDVRSEKRARDRRARLGDVDDWRSARGFRLDADLLARPDRPRVGRRDRQHESRRRDG